MEGPEIQAILSDPIMQQASIVCTWNYYISLA
jgi:hypothetical protein